MAERVGFEPTEPFRAHSISNAANSTTLAPFRKGLSSSFSRSIHLPNPTKLELKMNNEILFCRFFNNYSLFYNRCCRGLIIADKPRIEKPG